MMFFLRLRKAKEIRLKIGRSYFNLGENVMVEKKIEKIFKKVLLN